MISTRILCPAFIGRTEEIEHLLFCRRRAGDGHGGLVLVGGEPGIGKSRLLSEFKQQLNRRTCVVTSAACREFARKPLGPIVDLLAQLTGEKPRLASSSKSERLDSIAEIFRSASAKRTTVAIVEDLHWADVDLIQTLLVLAQTAVSERLLLVATYRDNELTPAHQLFKWFGRLVREPAASVISLRRLEPAELNRFMKLAVGDTVQLPAPVLHTVRERSEGNPLFAEELLRSAVDSVRLGAAGGPAPLPISLHAIVAERLNTCTDPARTLLRNASLFGRIFDVAEVARVFGGVREQMEPAASELCDLQLIDPLNVDRGVYRFRHALTRDVVYAEIPETVVRPLHSAIAENLERDGAAARAPEVLAHHLWQAGSRGEAARHYETAGDSAIAAFAYDDAAEFFLRAAAGVERDAVSRARLLARAAQALVFSGDLDGGLELYEQAATLEMELGDAAQVVRNRALMAGHLFDDGRRDAAIALLRQTLPFAERAERSLAVRLRTRLAMMLARHAQPEEAWNTLREIPVEDLDHRREWTGEYHLCASELHAVRGELDAWKADFEKGVAFFEGPAHPGPLHVAHANFGVQALYVGETAVAREHHRIAGQLAQTLRFDDQTMLQAQVEFYAGELVAASRIIEATVPSQSFFARAMLAQIAVPLFAALGDDGRLEGALEESLVDDAGQQPLSATLTRVAAARAIGLAALGRRDESRALVGQVLQSIDGVFGMALPILATVALIPERAQELRPPIESRAGLSRERIGKALLAMIDAAGAACRNDTPAAHAAGTGAARWFAEIGWPLFQARCLEFSGDMRGAISIYDRCGAKGELRRIEFKARPETSALAILTRRERELALEVASGKPNRAVAAALSIGEKTVEKYLTSIYAKLGITSRAQLAAFVATSRNRSE